MTVWCIPRLAVALECVLNALAAAVGNVLRGMSRPGGGALRAPMTRNGMPVMKQEIVGKIMFNASLPVLN